MRLDFSIAKKQLSCSCSRESDKESSAPPEAQSLGAVHPSPARFDRLLKTGQIQSQPRRLRLSRIRSVGADLIQLRGNKKAAQEKSVGTARLLPCTNHLMNVWSPMCLRLSFSTALHFRLFPVPHPQVSQLCDSRLFHEE